MDNNIGLLGHSRGGEAILAAERLIGTQTVANLAGLNNINSLFSLAATDQHEVERLNGKPYFVLYGSKDDDVSSAGLDTLPDPYNLGVPTTLVSGNSFTLHDRATGEQRSMAFVHGATHNGFVTLNNVDYRYTGGGSADILATEGIQRTMLDAYANAFFRKTLKGESFWFEALNGAWLPPSVQDASKPEVKIHFQFRNTGGQTILDVDTLADDTDFSDGKAVGILKQPLGLLAVTLDQYSQHGIKAIQIDISKFPVFEVYSGSALNANAYDFFSLRIAKMYGVATDLSGLEARLYNGTTPFNLKTPTVIPDAYERYDDVTLSKSAMITVRFPLASFSGFDKSNITKIEIAFGTSSGTAELSSFEFTD